MRFTPEENTALRLAYIQRLAITARGWWNASQEEREEALLKRQGIRQGLGIEPAPLPPTPQECGKRMEQLREIARQQAEAEARKAKAAEKKQATKAK